VGLRQRVRLQYSTRPLLRDSGHTHNGQIWPFNYLVRLSYRLLGGRYQVGDMTLLVGRGTGTWGPRMRLWQRSEILRITVRAPTP
jgi:predicted MPP superfamily phosphohydrolase